jgi:hypothetical protein
MYEAQDFARNVCGPRYNDEIEAYREAIELRMQAEKIEAIPAMMNMLKVFQTDRAPFTSQALLIAACVEICEPETITS